MTADATPGAPRRRWHLDAWPSRRTTLVLVVLGLVVLIPGGLLTEARFAATGYPGGGFGGAPLTLDPEQRRAEYQALAARDTLDDFRQVQVLDVGIIVGTALTFPALGVLAARRHPRRSRWRTVGLVAAVALAAAPIMDVLENATVLAMVTDPPGYPDWLGWLHIGFSLTKAALFVSGGVLLLTTAAGSVRTRRPQHT